MTYWTNLGPSRGVIKTSDGKSFSVWSDSAHKKAADLEAAGYTFSRGSDK